MEERVNWSRSDSYPVLLGQLQSRHWSVRSLREANAVVSVEFLHVWCLSERSTCLEARNDHFARASRKQSLNQDRTTSRIRKDSDFSSLRNFFKKRQNTLVQVHSK